jgi:hypothetical protein
LNLTRSDPHVMSIFALHFPAWQHQYLFYKSHNRTSAGMRFKDDLTKSKQGYQLQMNVVHTFWRFRLVFLWHFILISHYYVGNWISMYLYWTSKETSHKLIVSNCFILKYSNFDIISIIFLPKWFFSDTFVNNTSQIYIIMRYKYTIDTCTIFVKQMFSSI